MKRKLEPALGVPAPPPGAQVTYNNCTINNDYSTHNHYNAPDSPSYAYKLDTKLDWLPPCPPDSKVFQDDRGNLYKQCTNTRCPHNDISLFAPGPMFMREREPFLAAVAAAEAAVAMEDAAGFAAARETINYFALARCQRCRDSLKKTKSRPEAKGQQCKEEWERMKATLFSRCGECGCTHAVEANHLKYYADNKELHAAHAKVHGEEAADKKYPASERKLERLSHYNGWKSTMLGGVEGMRLEAPKCAPLCRMCHTLDPSSNSANENRADPAKVKREDKTQEQFTDARKKARYKKEKRDYVNKLKLLVGCCERPGCPGDGARLLGKVIPGFEQCFDWDHVDERTKGRAISDICRDRRCLRTTKPEIHAELGLPADFEVDNDPMPPAGQRKCRLLCRNCHHEREQWDPRAQR
tara:strand:- start:27071 stop:28306 length:1236 start_codon:yes stop_codon:yes gene_type:complete